MARAVALRRPMVFLDKIGRGFSERSIEDAFNDEAHRNLVIDGIEMMILGKVPEMVVLDYSAEALDGPLVEASNEHEPICMGSCSFWPTSCYPPT